MAFARRAWKCGRDAHFRQAVASKGLERACNGSARTPGLEEAARPRGRRPRRLSIACREPRATGSDPAEREGPLALSAEVGAQLGMAGRQFRSVR